MGGITHSETVGRSKHQMCDVAHNAHVHTPPLHFHVVAGTDLAFPTWGAGENVMKAPPYHFQIVQHIWIGFPFFCRSFVEFL